MDDRVAMQRGVAQFLLEEKYLLTAFEFLHELRAEGGQQGAEDLETFFADASRFSAERLAASREARESHAEASDARGGVSSGATPQQDRANETRVPEEEVDGRSRELEEKVSQLEKQLQGVTQELERERQRSKVVLQQQQQNQHLLQSRSVSENARGSLSRRQSEPARDSSVFLEKPADLAPLEEGEKEEINWAVREYLAEAGYKLTAMTFCDEEVEQDWEQPPSEQHCTDALDSASCPAGSLLRRLYFQALHLDALLGESQKKYEVELEELRKRCGAADTERERLVSAHKEETDQVESRLQEAQKARESAEELGRQRDQELVAAQSAVKHLESRVQSLQDSESNLQRLLEIEAELASSRKLRVIELESELLRQKQAAELAAAELEQKVVAESTRKLTASASADKAREGDMPSLLVRLTPPRSPSASHVTPPRSPRSTKLTPPLSPRSPGGRSLADLAKRQLAEMTNQVSELKELLEEERARANMLAAQGAPASSSSRGTSPVVGPRPGSVGESPEEGDLGGSATGTEAQAPALHASVQGLANGGPGTSLETSSFGETDPGTARNGTQREDGSGEGSGDKGERGEEREEEQVPRERMSKGELRAVRLISESLPKIAPNVLINHREELLPLILYAVERHPEKEARSVLIHGLFNLIKKPDEEQRGAIVGACADLAERLGGDAFEEEVMAHAWDELVHRNEEKRLLVSQLCPGVAKHVPKSAREGAVLSLMMGVTEDPAALVREAAALHLGQLLPTLDDISVYPQIEKVVFQLVCDSDGVVVDEALQSLVPAFVTWAIGRKHPFGQVLRAVMQRLRGEVEKCPPLVLPTPSNSKRPEVHMRSLGERERWNFGVLLRMLTGLLVEVRHVAYRTCPEALKHKAAEEPEGESGDGSAAGEGQRRPVGGASSAGGDDEATFITEGLLKRYAAAPLDWPAFDWLAVDCLPTLISLSLMVPPKEDDLRFRMCTFLLEVSRVLGRFYLMAVVLPVFLTAVGHSIDASTLHHKTAQKIAQLKPEGPPGERAAKMCTLPLLLGGVLGSPNMKEGYLKRYLKEWVLASCAKVGAWSQATTPELIDSVRFLCNKFGEHRDTMCTVLWDLVVNNSPAVRATAAVLFGTLAETSEPKKVSQQILPALVTLGADQGAEVKIATIGAFGRILRVFKDDAVVGKVKEQMDLFLEDGSHETSVAVLKALVPAVPVTTNALREYLLQKVHAMATNSQATAANISTRLDKTDAMCLAIRALEHTEMSSVVTSSLFLPSVQALLRDPEALEPGNKEALEAILKDRWAGQFGTFGKAMGKTLGILATSPNQPKGPNTSPAPAAGGGFSSFAAAFTSGSGVPEGSGANAWGFDTLTSTFEDRYGNKGSRNKLFK